MNEAHLRIREVDAGIEVALHVQPRARRSELSGLHGGALKLKISAPPVDDAANRAVIEFFSTLLGVPKSRLEIVSGLRSREKVLRINAISKAEFTRKLGVGGQGPGTGT